MLWVPETPHVSAYTDLSPSTGLIVWFFLGLTAQQENIALVSGISKQHRFDEVEMREQRLPTLCVESLLQNGMRQG